MRVRSSRKRRQNPEADHCGKDNVYIYPSFYEHPRIQKIRRSIQQKIRLNGLTAGEAFLALTLFIHDFDLFPNSTTTDVLLLLNLLIDLSIAISPFLIFGRQDEG